MVHVDGVSGTCYCYCPLQSAHRCATCSIVQWTMLQVAHLCADCKLSTLPSPSVLKRNMTLATASCRTLQKLVRRLGHLLDCAFAQERRAGLAVAKAARPPIKHNCEETNTVIISRVSDALARGLPDCIDLRPQPVGFGIWTSPSAEHLPSLSPSSN